MAIDKLTTDLNIISALDDEPNDVGGLTSAQLKAKFDEAGNDIKTFINDTLIPLLEDFGVEKIIQYADSDNAVKYIRLSEVGVLETSTDGETWEATGSHAILDNDGNEMAQQPQLQIKNASVADEDGKTIISIETAYLSAVNAGYSGTKEEFDAMLASIGTDLSGKLDTDGDAKDLTATFEEASEYAPIESGDKLSTIFGKIKKGFNLNPPTLVFDNTPTADSTNPVTSKGIKDYVDNNTPKTPNHNFVRNAWFKENTTGTTSWTGKGYTIDNWLTSAGGVATNCNHNFAKNAWFKDNSQGLTEYTSSSTPQATLDNWYCERTSGNKIVVNDDYISMVTIALTSNSYFYQNMNVSLKATDTFTVSIAYRTSRAVEGYGSGYRLRIGTEINTEDATVYLPTSEDWTIFSHTYASGGDTTLLQAGFQNAGNVLGTEAIGDQIDVKAIKVELGSVSTLANETAESYANDWNEDSNDTVVVVANGITFTNTAETNWLKQYISNASGLIGKTMTLSIDAEVITEGAKFRSLVQSSDGTASTNFTADLTESGVSTITFVVPEDVSTLAIGVNLDTAGASVLVKKGKLELGSVSTLANETVENYTDDWKWHLSNFENVNHNFVRNAWFRENTMGGKLALKGVTVYSDTSCSTVMGTQSEYAAKAVLNSNGTYTRYVSGSASGYVKASDVIDGWIEAGYICDDWILWATGTSTSVVLGNNKLTITNGGVACDTDISGLVGNTVTVSAIINGAICSFTVENLQLQDYSNLLPNGIWLNIFLYDDLLRVYIGIDELSGSFELSALKVSVGATPTLANETAESYTGNWEWVKSSLPINISTSAIVAGTTNIPSNSIYLQYS